MDPRSEPVKEWELAIGATPGAWQPGRMQLAPLTSDEWKSKLTQGTGVRIKERGGREKTVGDVKLLNDTLSDWVNTGVALIRRIRSSPLDETKSNIQAEGMKAFNTLRNRIDNFSFTFSDKQKT